MTNTLIISKDNQYGLTRDNNLLMRAMSNASNLEVRTANIRDRNLFNRFFQKREAERAVHMERFFPHWCGSADTHWLIPNQERFPQRHLRRLKKVDLVLGKSRHAVEIFHKLGARAEYLGYTSEDRYDPTIEKHWDSFFHLAGGSTLKGTEDLISLWGKHPEWPRLTLVQKEKNAAKILPDNVNLLSGYMSDDTLRVIQNRHGMHLCPSRAEGWGHHLVEAMSTASLIIATDAPPMNEHLTHECALLVPYNRTEPRRLGTSFFVDMDVLERKIQLAIEMNVQSKRAFGEAARARFQSISTCFQSRVKVLFCSTKP